MTKVRKTFLYFMLYSIIGWLYEVFLEVVVYKWGFSNRGTLFGPYCVIYGFGALLMIACFQGLKKKKMNIGKVNLTPLVIFIGILLLTTVVELIGSYVLEFTQGGWSWDYTRFAFNFQGRVALNPSVRFGIGGIVVIYLIQPLFQKLTDKLPDKQLKIITNILCVIIIIDMIYTFLIK